MIFVLSRFSNTQIRTGKKRLDGELENQREIWQSSFRVSWLWYWCARMTLTLVGSCMGEDLISFAISLYHYKSFWKKEK